MQTHPLFRPLAVATVVIGLAAGLLLWPARDFEARLAGLPLALLQGAENASEGGRVLWADTGEGTADTGRLRGDLAHAIDAAHLAGARAILLAVPLEQSSDSADLARVRSFLEGVDSSPDPSMRARLTAWAAELDHDAQLERAIRAAGNVVLLGTPTATPLERFASAARGIGIEPAAAPDADGVARRDRLLGRLGPRPSAPSATFAAWLAAHGASLADARMTPQGIRVGETLLRTDSASGWVPQYGRRAGEQGGTPSVTLADLAAGRVAVTQLAQQILVIGRGTALIATPTGPGLTLGEALAQRLTSLESGSYFVRARLARLATFVLLLAAIAFAALAAPALSPAPRAAAVLFTAFVLIAAELVLLAEARVWIPLLEASLGLVLATLAVWVVPDAPSPRARAVATEPPWQRYAATPPAPKGSAASAGRSPPAAPGPAPAPSLRNISQTLEARRVEPTPSDVADVLLGRAKKPSKPKLGRYELERELGRGAMGTVYLGRDPRINRVVAIKAIPIVEEFTETELAEARERFFREAEMAGRLKHPGIVTVHDAGEDGGIAWIAMEYLNGRLLSEYAASDRLLPPSQALEVVARIADALDYAHAQNVIHRDIKPANVMFDPQTLETKITDFGIARLTNSSATRSGIVLGTPSFMAPEQLEGRNVTGRTDLFALGVTLFQLTTGQLPFRADSMTGLMDRIANAPPPPLRTIRPDLPACVSAIIDRALQKDPAARFQTGGEMAAAVRTCARALAA
ncbi:MAG TPA: protein kinase [Steroidobacteraceae bacterium]|nr:protein kinase [Steroidobacteraceae bacterium]